MGVNGDDQANSVSTGDWISKSGGPNIRDKERFRRSEDPTAVRAEIADGPTSEIKLDWNRD